MSYPYGGGGYPQQPGGYPPQGGYGAPGGYPPQGGAPPVQMPDPMGGGYPMGQAPYPGAGNTPYPAQPDIGFGGMPPAGGMAPAPGVALPTPGGAPGAQPTYNMPMPGAGMPPSGPGYGTQPPSQYPGAPGGGYGAPPQPAPSGYPAPGAPPHGQSAYPAPGGGYPAPAAPAQGYGGGYPSAPQGSAYPNTGAPLSVPGKAGGVPPIQHQMAHLSLSGNKGGSTPKYTMAQGTVKPVSPFQPDNDATILRKAMKGLGTDEKAIIDVLSKRSNSQRQEISKMFKTMHGRDLIKDLKSELGGKFEDVIIGLMMKSDEYDAQLLNKAMSGLGTDETALVEIMCTRTNSQIHAIRDAYKRLYKKDLESDLRGDTSGHFQKLMVSMSVGGRMENQPVDINKAKEDATALYQAGEARWGTDESKFNQILASQSFPQLQAVFQEYGKQYRKTIEQAITSEMSGDLKSGMLTIVKCVNNRSAYFAEALYRSMKGAGTDDRTLIRVVVTRCEVDMVQIKQEFQKNYGQTLEAFIRDDCSGDYKRALLALVGGHY